jgi:hypothetical protein
MVVPDRLADVELIDLQTVYFVALHADMLRCWEFRNRLAERWAQLEKVQRGTKEWYLEVSNLSDLLQKWKDHPDDVIQMALQQSLETLGLIEDI